MLCFDLPKRFNGLLVDNDLMRLFALEKMANCVCGDHALGEVSC